MGYQRRAQSKADAIARREYLTNLDDQAVEKYRTQQLKVTEKNERVKGAQDRIINLLKFVDEQLGKDADQIHLVGSTEHTMELIKDFLNKALDEEEIELPKIMNGEREDGNNDNLIYKHEYNQLHGMLC